MIPDVLAADNLRTESVLFVCVAFSHWFGECRFDDVFANIHYRNMPRSVSILHGTRLGIKMLIDCLVPVSAAHYCHVSIHL